MKHCILLVIILTALSACSDKAMQQYNQDDSEQITIGAVYPEQNDIVTYLKKGIDLAEDEINAQGGVLGKPIDIVFKDDGNDGNKALQIAQDFAKSGITAVIGHWSSDICYITEDIYEENGVVLLMPCATSRSVFDYNYNYVFRVCSNNQEYTSAIAEYIAEKGYDNIAICYSDDVFGFDFANSAETELATRGITVIDRVTNLTEMTAERISERWNAFGCEGVILCNVIPGSIDIINAIRGMDKNYPIWGADNFQRTNLVSLLDNDPSSLYRVENDFYSDDLEFYGNFISRYGHKPDIFATAGYSAVYMIADAINTCGSTDGTMLAEYLSQLVDYPSAAGLLTYDKESQEFTGRRLKVVPVAR